MRPECLLEISFLSGEFHKEYCHSVYEFSGRRLVRYVSQRAEENTFIMYRESSSSLIAILPPGAIQATAPHLKINYQYFDRDHYEAKVIINGQFVFPRLFCDNKPVSSFYFSLSILDVAGNILHQANYLHGPIQAIGLNMQSIDKDQTLILWLAIYQ